MLQYPPKQQPTSTSHRSSNKFDFSMMSLDGLSSTSHDDDGDGCADVQAKRQQSLKHDRFRSEEMNNWNNTKVKLPLRKYQIEFQKNLSFILPKSGDIILDLDEGEERKNKAHEVQSCKNIRTTISSKDGVKKKKTTPVKNAPTKLTYQGLIYIGPTKANRPHYKSKQAWEWEIYPHGISKQNDKLRVQIKQKGLNPTYPSFPNSYKGLLEAAMFRDKESYRLWESKILVRPPKFNFEHPNFRKPEKRRRKRRRKSSKKDSKSESKSNESQSEFMSDDRSMTLEDMQSFGDLTDLHWLQV
mmetsp:Transcript_3824/g.5102  ORF Transcript_3824/g.5102 Transcript_3824/m.5102 type:complete len:300 (+) Transcript_3824:146-1045(+)|eukprot:jgi/Bigna1/77675/fgenesh1_pg.49_\